MQHVITIENGVTRHPLYRMIAVSYKHMTLPTTL